MVPSVLQKAIALLDDTILTVISAFQFLGCLAGIAALLLFSRYPGADFDALPVILFLGAASATAIILTWTLVKTTDSEVTHANGGYSTDRLLLG